MKDWQRIRLVRHDITDYVVHFTRSATTVSPFTYTPAADVLLQILRDGFIKPTFAPLANRYSRTKRATVKGPDPAVCLTEQPLWAVVRGTTRYSGYGIAYPKYLLHQHGGRPVMYGTERELGVRLVKADPGFHPEKDIFRDGLPPSLQYLWVNYQPTIAAFDDYPIDFTWEREWRIKPRVRGMLPRDGLPVALSNAWGAECDGAIVVERDADVDVFSSEVIAQRTAGKKWAKYIRKVVSLEAVKRSYLSDERYGRIETYPDGTIDS